MRTLQRTFLAAAVVVAASLPASAETLQYKWSMHGGLSWVAGLKFPTSGTGQLIQTPSGSTVTSTLKITSPKEPSAALVYQSTMAPLGERTFASAEGYDWQDSTRHVSSFFDSVKRLLHIQKTTSKGTETSVKPWAEGDVRDMLTAIQYLRVHGNEVTRPIATTAYSAGKAYPVVIAPSGTSMMKVAGTPTATLQFRIQAAPGAAAKYPGEVRLWISNDARRLPVRIELAQKLTTVRLDLVG